MQVRDKDRSQHLIARCHRIATKLSIVRTTARRRAERLKKTQQQLNSLRQRYAPIPIANHTYPAQLIALAVFMVTQANCSLRATALTLQYVSQLLGWSYAAPSHVTVGRWVLRCGLASLRRVSQLSGRYVLILDESVQIGREKLLLLLAVPYDLLCSVNPQPLSHAQVEVIGLKVAQSWTGTAIAEFIAQRLKAIPDLTIAYAVSDGGPNICRALRLCGIDRVADCTHVMANLIAQQFAGTPSLSALNHHHSSLRSKWLMTSKSYLVTSTIRYKDRILKIFRLAQWVQHLTRHYQYLDDQVRQELHFLSTAQQTVADLLQVKYLFEVSSRLLKTQGLSPATRLALSIEISQYRNTIGQSLGPPAEAFIKGIYEYMDRYLVYRDELGNRVLCCSDVIESLFGRYKNKGGMAAISGDVLGIALYGKPMTPHQVKAALEEVSYPMVADWLKDNTCATRYAQMSQARKQLNAAAA